MHVGHVRSLPTTVIHCQEEIANEKIPLLLFAGPKRRTPSCHTEYEINWDTVMFNTPLKPRINGTSHFLGNKKNDQRQSYHQSTNDIA
jgi:hypothetical protein